MELVTALPASHKSNRPLFALLSALFLLKFGLLLSFKPVLRPDSEGYISFADIILRRPGSLLQLNLHASLLDITAFRMIGYPFLIAVLKSLFSNWTFFLSLFQICASLYASYALFHFAARKGLPGNWALVGTAAYSASYPLAIDQFILTDSLFAALCVIYFSKTDSVLYNGDSPSARKCLSAGLAGSALFLMRDTAPVVILAMLPILACAVCLRPNLLQLRNILLLLLPFALSATLYAGWNFLRSGTFFITTGSQMSFLYPIMKIAPRHPEVISGNDPVSETARQTFHRYEFSEVYEINKSLHSEYGFTAVQIAQLARDKFWKMLWRHPLIMLKNAYHEIPWAILVAPFRTLEAIKDLAEANAPTVYWPSTRRLLEKPMEDWKVTDVLFVVIVNLCRLAGLTVTLFFLFGVPRMFAQQRNPRSLAFLAYWVAFLIYILSHALVHIEDRYLVPAYAISSSFGMLMLYEYFRQRKPIPA